MSYLHLSYRKGKLMAGYLYLDDVRKKSARTKVAEAGLVVDFDANNAPIGIEITSPSLFNIEALNRVLSSLGVPLATPADLGPLVAA